MQKNFKIRIIGANILVFISGLLVFGIRWFTSTFDALAIDEIIFHLKVPMTGSNNEFVIEFIKSPFLKSLFILVIFNVMLFVFFKILNNKVKKRWVINILIFIPIISLLLFSIVYASNRVGLKEYLASVNEDSLFVEYHYINPKEDILTFPNKHRNLIYIFLESYEATFTSKEFGGALAENTLGEMVDLAFEHTHFSHNELIGGAATAVGTSWTVGGMVGQTSGIHLKLPINGNSYGDFKYFLPGVVSIGDILHSQDYNQVLFIGSDADFGGRSNYFEQHGNYAIKDYKYAIANNLIPKDYLEWWGYEDEKLYEFAKDEILDLAKSNKPFNFTMLTADTHHVDGYVTAGMEEPFDHQYKNVFYNSSKQVVEFIYWIKDQDFYKDTTIVIAGDHNSMDAQFIIDNVDRDYDRRIFNLIINPAKQALNTNNRIFTSLDLFPTTISSLGIEIAGNRLGLGTDLFSKEQTLFEQYGLDYVNEELAKHSTFYVDEILTK